MRNKNGFKAALLTAGLLVTLASCATVQERTAPCKRSTAVSSFAEDRSCPEGGAVNGDPTSALAAIDQILVP